MTPGAGAGAAEGSTLRGLLPDGVSLAEASDNPFELFPEERAALGAVTPKRLRDHGAGRAMARRALAQLGLAPIEIPVGPDRAPVWPEGIVGSITHCGGYVAAAVARARDILALGIDAEPIRPLERGVIERIGHADELAQLARHCSIEVIGVLLFSAKESVFKAWFPLARRWLDFADVRLAFDWRSGSFSAQIRHDAQVDGCPARFDGRFRIGTAHVLTAAVGPRRRGSV
jgi:enterobactin synthetase component D / holo-[acyl-carrier protein] synthase